MCDWVYSETVELITSEFKETLEAKQVDLAGIQDEVEEIVLYALKLLNINMESYQKVWYKLHTYPGASKWQNLIRVCELVISLPFSNAHAEQLFSTLKVIKPIDVQNSSPQHFLTSLRSK